MSYYQNNDMGMSPGALEPGTLGTSGDGRSSGMIFFLMAGLILAMGIGLFVFFLIRSISGMGDDMVRLVVPGERTFRLEEPGSYTVFHEYRSVVDGKVYSSGAQLGSMNITLTGPSGENVPLGPLMSNQTYNMGSTSAYGVFSFSAGQAGEYHLSAFYQGGEEGPETVLAIDKGFVTDLLITIFSSIGILFLTVFVSVALIVLAVVRGRRPRRVLPMSQSGPGQYGGFG